MLIKDISKISKNKIPEVIIVGSGPAGISLALNLEKKKINCLILEAGKEEVSYDSQDFYKGEVIGLWPKDLTALRLRQFGGTTGHWGGSCRTLDSYDFNQWPIKKDDLDKYLDQASEILNIKKGLFIDDDVNNDIKKIEWRTSDVRFYEKYYDYIIKSKNIFLALNTSLLNFEFEDNNVSSIICRNRYKKNFKLKTKFYILATGGIENSRILKWSVYKGKKKSLQDLPIGNYFMEHPWKTVGYVIGSQKKFIEFFKSSATSFAPTEYFMKKNKVLNAVFNLKMEDKKTNPDLEKVCFELKSNNQLISFVEKTHDLCGSKIVSAWEQDPVFENRITLSRKRDPFGVPMPKIIYKKSKITMDTIRIVLENLGKTFIDQKIGRIAIEDFFYDDKDFMTDAGYHHLGGTRMGDDPKNSVVDKDLKVHFIDNLYVAGSSVFTTGGYANPTLSIVQLSLRLSDHLLEKLTV